MIKKQYLGADKVKKKMLKPSEKFKFNFDWEASDDTSRDLNPLYNSTHEVTFLFGSGARAGVDRREQKKQAAVHKAELMRKIRQAQVRCSRPAYLAKSRLQDQDTMTRCIRLSFCPFYPWAGDSCISERHSWVWKLKSELCSFISADCQ